MPEHPASNPGSPRQLPLCRWGWGGLQAISPGQGRGWLPQTLSETEDSTISTRVPMEGSRGVLAGGLCLQPPLKDQLGKSPCPWSGG